MSLTDLLKLERPLVGLDLETTGTNVDKDRVVQVGLVKLYPDGRMTEWQTLVNPGMPLPADVAKFFADHGVNISDEAIQHGCAICARTQEQHNREEALDEVGQRCEGGFKPVPSFVGIAPILYAGLNGCDLLGYNLGRFDVPLLRAEFARAAITWTPGLIVDGFRMAQRANPHNLSWFVEKYIGTVADFKAHDALHDARQTVRGIEGFLQAHGDFPRSVQKLHDMFFVDPRDSSTLDPDGKFAWKGTEAIVNFGKKHNGKTLREVKALDPGFLRNFILNGDFTETVKKIAREALEGRFPARQA